VQVNLGSPSHDMSSGTGSVGHLDGISPLPVDPGRADKTGYQALRNRGVV